MVILYISGTSCEFESNTMCGWKNSGRDNSNFKLTAAGSSPGPKTDHTISNANGSILNYHLNVKVVNI